MNKNYDETVYVCFSKLRAIKLREKGFEIIRTAVNRRFPQYDVYYFQNSPEIQKAVEELKKESEEWRANHAE